MMAHKYKIPENSFIQDQSIHCAGNGSVCAYFKGPDIIQMFGPHYGVPSSIQMQSLVDYDRISRSRIPGTAIWKQELYFHGQKQGSIVDFADSSAPIHYRKIRFTKQSQWKIEIFGQFPIHLLPESFELNGNCCFGEIPSGQPFYTQSTFERFPRAAFVTDRPYYFAVYASEGILLEPIDSLLVCTGKAGIFSFIFAETFDELLRLIRQNDSKEFSFYFKQRNTHARWLTFTRKRRMNKGDLSSEYEKIVDDIAVMIKSQQSKSGGVLAGYNYHLAYIRDNYGVLRGLLAMGCFEEAKNLLLYYRNIFKEYGRINNAQGTDTYAFHIHENDDVEITSYMILMCLDYFKQTEDLKTFLQMIPLMIWCIMKQHESLHEGMLTFNGDETYIAGGLIPRSVIYNGSMEATLLYHTAISKLLVIQETVFLPELPLDEMRSDQKKINDSFNRHFVRDGQLMCNYPSPKKTSSLPLYRFGVRLCGHGFGLSFRRKDQSYVCVDCVLNDSTLETDNTDKLYKSYSAILMAIYVGSVLIDPGVLENEIQIMLNQYEQTGTLSSEVLPGKMTGYDPGLLLYAIKDQAIPQKDDIRQHLLELRDQAGVYVEYYMDGKPSGTMCRPWESGVNISTLI